MLKCIASSGISGFEAFTEYEAPPVQRDPLKRIRSFHAPKKTDKNGVLPFCDEVVSEKPNPMR